MLYANITSFLYVDNGGCKLYRYSYCKYYYIYFIRRNFRERNSREFRELCPFSRKFVLRKFSKWQFAKVYPVKVF